MFQVTRLKIVAASTLAAMTATICAPLAVYADGAASTRNILIGGAAATLIILNHNKKVHQRYAEDAQRQAALAEQRDDARAALVAEKRAYSEQVALNSELRKEVAFQHNVIQQQRRQIAALNGRTQGFIKPVVAEVRKPSGTVTKVAVVSYGWGVQ